MCRKSFIRRCLDSEIRMNRWTHLTSEETNGMELKDPSLKEVRRIPIPETSVAEFHVDSHEALFTLVNE